MKSGSAKEDNQTHGKKELDAKVLDIEFLLISVVQGVALTSLAAAAAGPMSNLDFQYWPAIMAGFLFILIFWSQAIIHALSFIDWPLNLGHTFLYFLASFIEVMAFAQVENPLKWFVFITLFLIVAAALYIYDLRMIKEHEKDFSLTEAKRKLYDHMYTRQVRELTRYVPFALFYNGLCAVLIYLLPEVFIASSGHVVLTLLQVIFGALLLTISYRSFNVRSRLITNL